jgi:hypothetical protein
VEWFVVVSHAALDEIPAVSRRADMSSVMCVAAIDKDLVGEAAEGVACRVESPETV